MDNILINLDDGIRLGGSELPNVSEQSDIISQSDTLVGPPGPPGPQGPAGQDGVDGQAATITVGSTTTGAAGTNASVTNSGTTSAAVLNFTIPRGETGETGETGPVGPAGQDGLDGAAATITVGSVITVDPEYPATVNNSGTTSAAVLDFEIPRGVPGETGPAGRDGVDGTDGVDGQAATITVGTTTTLPAGSSATVTNSGTTSAAVLDFGIPQGPQGFTATVLFTGASSSDVALSENVSNFDYVEIYGYESGNRPVYLKIIGPALNVKFSLSGIFFVNNTLYVRTRTYTFTSNTQITASTSDLAEVQIKASGNTVNSGYNGITITKVIGYNLS